MRTLIPLAVTSLFVGQAQAAELAVQLVIPRLDVAEYHRPYVAVWIEGPDQKVAANLAVWYDQKQHNNEGQQWLKDLRQWWRRSGRDLTLPVDGVTGATRPVGEQQLVFTEGKSPLGKLPAGKYELVVEAAREVGGRELLRVPFQWPPAPSASAPAQAQGQTELGRVTVSTKP